jgi:hypothetical protein
MTHVKEEGIPADALYGLDKESGQLALYVDQVVQSLFVHVCE